MELLFSARHIPLGRDGGGEEGVRAEKNISNRRVLQPFLFTLATIKVVPPPPAVLFPIPHRPDVLKAASNKWRFVAA